MKEEEFNEELEEKGFYEGVARLELHYTTDENGNVVFDFEDLDTQTEQIKREITDILE
jgi:hypothetical protein